jgi:hypothetical protein
VSRERDHHFVPEFHLRRFATGRRREVAVFDKRWGKFGRRPAASSAHVRDYYLVPGASVDERLAVERDFARLENLVAPVMARLDQEARGPVFLAEDERYNLAAYAAVLHVRVPAYRDDAMKRAQELAVDLDALGLADPIDYLNTARRLGFQGTDEQLERRRVMAIDALESGAMRIRWSQAASLGGLTPAMQKGVPLLLAREWELLRAPMWPGFIIGDQPVALFSHGSLAPSIGFGSPDVQVFMPFSSRTLLLISDRPRSPGPMLVKSEGYTGLREPWWATANKIAWLTAQRYVWGLRSDLQATDLLIPAEYQRRDLRQLDPEQEARRCAVAAERRRERRAISRERR